MRATDRHDESEKLGAAQFSIRDMLLVTALAGATVALLMQIERASDDQFEFTACGIGAFLAAITLASLSGRRSRCAACDLASACRPRR